MLDMYALNRLNADAGYVRGTPVKTTEYISIRCVTAFYGFRPYGGSLLANAECRTIPKVTKRSWPYHTAASPRLAGALTPALLWGHAATGHPWPIAAGAASCRATPITAPAFGLL